METGAKIRYWALYSHIYFFFEAGGTLDEALRRWGSTGAVLYFYDFFRSKA